jgi:hypothetical protein
MLSTIVQWYDSHGIQQEVILPGVLPPKKITKLQEYFQNTPDGPQRILRQMGRADLTWNPAPASQPQRNRAEKITSGSFEGSTQDEVAVMAEMGLLAGPLGEAIEPPKEEEEDEEEEEDKEESLAESEPSKFTGLPPESPSPPVDLPVCRPPTPERSPPGDVGERSWHLRVNQDLTLEKRVYSFEGLMARLQKAKGTLHV